MSRKPDIAWESCIVVDKTIQYDAAPDAGLFDYDDWCIQKSGIPELSQKSRVDVFVQKGGSGNAVWIVEVKDLRILDSCPEARPGKKVIEDLDKTLGQKLSDTLEFVRNHAESPLNLQEVFRTVPMLSYVAHIELPQTWQPYLPDDYPQTQFQNFLCLPVAKEMNKAMLYDAAAINKDTSLPWNAMLLPVNVAFSHASGAKITTGEQRKRRSKDKKQKGE